MIAISREQLFIRTLNEIKSRMHGDVYELIRCCGLLRHLLIDSPNLYSLCNKTAKIKPIFTMPSSYDRNHFKPPKGNAIVEYISIIHTAKMFVHLDINKFLAFPILRIKDTIYSIYDIIDYAAHILGGVHSKSEKTEHHKNLSSLDELVLMSPTPDFELIQDICKVTLKAFEPLELFIKEHTPTGGF
jgi:hypothetical protein